LNNKVEYREKEHQPESDFFLRGLICRTLRTLGRLYPLPSGQPRLGSLWIVCLACQGVTLAGAGQSGIDFIYTNLTDAHGRSAHFFGCNDGKIRDIIRRIVRPGDTVIDIGANYGAYSLLAARMVGSSGRVHAFEPQLQLAALLRRSAAANRFSHLAVHAVALSDRDGTATLYGFASDTGLASLTSPGPEHSRTPIIVPTRCGDSLFRELGLTSIRLIKIDTEKHEERVLRGAEAFLRQYPPDYILFEYFDPCLPFWDATVIKNLRELGYTRLYEIPRTLVRTKIRPILSGTKPGHLTLNFLAQHDSVDESLVPH
jgi:FkbM family methyltransferase